MGILKRNDIYQQKRCKAEKERTLLVTTDAFGKIRKDLIQNIGSMRTKGFLFRYGWGLGRRDALKVKNREDMTLKEKIFAGPLSHTKTGQVIAESTQLKIDEKNNNAFVHMEGTWYQSYEAEEHLKQFGKSDVPVCHTLTGYASGYLSALFHETIIVKETTCAAEGARFCRWIAKRATMWKEEAAEYIDFLTEKPIILELEETYEELLERKNNAAKISEVQKTLTDAIIAGGGFQTITEKVAAIIHAPILIENDSLETLAVTPMLHSTYDDIKESFAMYIQMYGSVKKTEKNHFLRTMRNTKVIDLPYYKRVMTPIYLQRNIYGYASILLPHTEQDTSLAEAIVERIATFCSLYLLNEQMKYETLERMKGNLLEDLIDGIVASEMEVIQRGKYMQVDLAKPFYLIVLQYSMLQNVDICEILLQEKLLDTINRFNQKNELNMLIASRTNYFYLYLPVELGEDEVESYITDLIQWIKKNFPYVRLRAGISERGTDFHKVKELYKQATVAVRLAEKDENVISFSTIGMISALVAENNEETILQNAECLLRPIFQQEKTDCEEALLTLYTYLKNARNLEQTAEELALSISGVRYRVRKIEQTLGRKLTDPIFNYELLLALQSLRIIGKVCLFR